MDAIERFFSKPRNIVIVAAAVGAVLIVAIAVVVVALLGGSDKQNNQTTKSETDGGSSFSSGNVSSLSGKTSSYRNLKGLTLRINQIETCNPKVVSAYVAVSTDDGVVNKNFGKQDVKIYLDGTQVSTFTFDPVSTAKTPLTNSLVIDHSGSMAGSAMDNAKSAAATYAKNLKENDRANVIQFDDRVEVLQNTTSNKAKIASAIKTIQPRGDTALYDAIVKGIKTTPNCGRKAVTVLTDGEDTASRSESVKSVIAAASDANLPVFSVGIKGSQFNPSAIKDISESTGAQYLEANTPKEVTSLYKKIDGQLTGQFVANLQLNIDKDGKKHTLKIVSTVEGSDTASERSFVY